MSKASSLSRQIFNQQWEKVSDLLKNEQVAIGDSISKEVDEFTILHYASCFNPPLVIMQDISSRFPGSASNKDCNGRYPLHLACKYGVSPDVIRFLIKAKPLAAGIQDCFGKTPMHYVGESYAKFFLASLGFSKGRAGRSANKILERSMVHVVEMLEEAAPESANIMDADGRVAVEYALDNEAEMSVIRAMQLASRDDWRKRKAEFREKRHEELVLALEALRTCQIAVEESVDEQDTEEKEKGSTKKFGIGNAFYLNLHHKLKSRKQGNKERLADIKPRRLPAAKSA